MFLVSLIDDAGVVWTAHSLVELTSDACFLVKVLDCGEFTCLSAT